MEDEFQTQGSCSSRNRGSAPSAKAILPQATAVSPTQGGEFCRVSWFSLRFRHECMAIQALEQQDWD
jgi:hypothetical protein